MNANVLKKQKENEERRQKIKEEQRKQKSLEHLENRIETLLVKEAMVVLGEQTLNKLRTIYEACKEEEQDFVNFN